MESKIKTYIDGLEFGLKDFDKTHSKWINYKTEKVNLLFGENGDYINQYLEDGLKDSLIIAIDTQPHLIDNLMREGLKKSLIRSFMTSINGLTIQSNLKFIKSLTDDLNDTEKRAFNIVFYLKNYEKINQIMKDVLSEQLQTIDNNRLFKELKK